MVSSEDETKLDVLRLVAERIAGRVYTTEDVQNTAYKTYTDGVRAALADVDALIKEIKEKSQ